jgi:XapX domain-containing protein
MAPYLEALGAGLLIGAVYALFRVKSPAPPLIGLLGLAAMLVGYQLAGIVL